MLDPTKRGAWFGDPAFKQEIVDLMREHRRRDRFIQGEYWKFQDHDKTLDNFKGCAIGCLLQSKAQGFSVASVWNGRWHREVEQEFNIPHEVAWQIDVHFEGCNGFEEAGEFAVASIEAIPVGANLNEVVDQLRHFGWHTGSDNYASSGSSCEDCVHSLQLKRDRDVFLKELSNAPIMPAARALILAG